MSIHYLNGVDLRGLLPGPDEPDLSRLDARINAEDYFDRVISGVARMSFEPGDNAKIALALSAVLGAWAGVIRARGAG